MSGTQIGQITHYFDHINIAALTLTETLRVGETIHILVIRLIFNRRLLHCRSDISQSMKQGPAMM
jgi:hypothetical protein